METIGIIGAGTMGAGIAQVALMSGCTVTLSDLSGPALSKAKERIAADLRKLTEKSIITDADATAMLARLTLTENATDLRDATFVIEAAIEQVEPKKAIIRTVTGVCGTGTIFATNTSSLSVTELAAASSAPDRFIGMHFFNPPTRMKLVEVVRGYQTSDATVTRTV